MPNLKNAVSKISLNSITGLDELQKLEDNLYNISDNLPKDVKELAKYDANIILTAMLQGYVDYIERYLPAREKDTASNPVGYVLETKDGYDISLYGKNLWYYEFGTGDKGEQGNYRSKNTMSKHGYVYNAGPKVIHANTYDPEADYDDPSIPTMYKRAVKKHPGMERHNWWVSPHGLSNGIPPASVLYDTYTGYKDDLESKSSTKWSLTPNKITFKIKNELLKGLKGR